MLIKVGIVGFVDVFLEMMMMMMMLHVFRPRFPCLNSVVAPTVARSPKGSSYFLLLPRPHCCSFPQSQCQPHQKVRRLQEGRECIFGCRLRRPACDSQRMSGSPMMLLDCTGFEPISVTFDYAPRKAKTCVDCGAVGTITMVPGKRFPIKTTRSQAPLMQFDCDGLEPLGFLFRNLWKGLRGDGTKINDIDLSGGKFAFPEEGNESLVQICNLRSTFKLARK